MTNRQNTMPRERNARWTDAEDSALKKMLSDGYSFNQIGEALCRTRGMVGGRVHRLGLCCPGTKSANLQREASRSRETAIARLFDIGNRPSEIADRLGLTKRTIERSLIRSGRKMPRIPVIYTDVDLVGAFDEGKTRDEIAEEFMCSEKTVFRALVRHGRQAKRMVGAGRSRPMNGYIANRGKLKRRDWIDFSVDEHSGPLVALLDLQAGQCRWPVDGPEGNAATRRFCGCPRAHDRTPYCARHHAIAYCV